MIHNKIKVIGGFSMYRCRVCGYHSDANYKVCKLCHHYDWEDTHSDTIRQLTKEELDQLKYTCSICNFKNNYKFKECPICGGKNTMRNEEEDTLNAISTDPQFLQAMRDLKEKDIIEYELKMSQFRSQIEQKNQAQATQAKMNVPHCPTCGSTNIEKISAGKKIKGSILFGLFSSDVRNQMHCKSCGHKW